MGERVYHGTHGAAGNRSIAVRACIVWAAMDLLTLPLLPALIGLLIVAAVAVGTLYIACHWRQDGD